MLQSPPSRLPLSSDPYVIYTFLKCLLTRPMTPIFCCENGTSIVRRSIYTAKFLCDKNNFHFRNHKKWYTSRKKKKKKISFAAKDFLFFDCPQNPHSPYVFVMLSETDLPRHPNIQFFYCWYRKRSAINLLPILYLFKQSRNTRLVTKLIFGLLHNVYIVPNRRFSSVNYVS